MEERLISFETAVLASNKGYHPILLGYNFRDKLPTQSLLQKWLREIHKIDINIECFQDDEGNIEYDYVVYFINAPKVDWEDGPWLIYEDCLEVALNRGLNYIIK